MAYQFKNIKILVVENNDPMRNLVKSLLLTFGVGEVMGAVNGEQGFDVFCEESPDLVIADWLMDPVNGIELVEKIRRDSRSPNPFVPVILMTGFSEKRRVEWARDTGVTEFLVKPFTARTLYERIAIIIERPRQFVRAPDFFGPDRRRKSDKGYNGPDRRGNMVQQEKDTWYIE